MRRRTVLATVGATAVAPLLAGCSDPGTTIGLEPGTVEVVGTVETAGTADDESAGDPGAVSDDDWTWDVTYELAYELEGLEESDGLYGVTAHLVDGQGVELARVDHGDLAWEGLSEDERETGEYEDGIEYYRADRRESTSTTVERFPRWVVFTVDRAVGSGVWTDVDVFGATTDVIVPTSGGGTGATNRTEGDGAALDARNDTAVNETELSIDREGMVVPDEHWERIRQDRYDSYPPIDEIPSDEERSAGDEERSAGGDGRASDDDGRPSAGDEGATIGNRTDR